jgi:hypothetical protein
MIKLYSLISNYETSNKYNKHLNICAQLFNVVATIIQVRGLRIICVKHFEISRGYIILCVKIERSTEDSSSSFSCLRGVWESMVDS